MRYFFFYGVVFIFFCFAVVAGACWGSSWSSKPQCVPTEISIQRLKTGVISLDSNAVSSCCRAVDVPQDFSGDRR